MGGISLYILFALCVAAFIVIALAAALILAIVVSVLVLGVSSTVVAASGAIGTGFIQNKRAKRVLLYVWACFLAFGLSCIALLCWWWFVVPGLQFVATALAIAIVVIAILGIRHAQVFEKKVVRYLILILFYILLVAGALVFGLTLAAALLAPTWPELEAYLPFLF